MVTATSALLNVIDANNKARSLKTAINNVTFALEGISKDMRMGTDYSCSNNGGSNFIGSCSGGGDAIKFKSSKTDSRPEIYYKHATTTIAGKEVGQIKSCVVSASINCDRDDDYLPITSAEVNITNMRFYILGVESPNDNLKTQPRMIMTLSGLAGDKAKIQTNFDLQTSVSQVNRPE
jgi:hypothetical protein